MAPPASGYTRDASEFAGNWGAVVEGIEKRQIDALTLSAVEDVKVEYANYIAAVEQAPRYLVGKTVPRADGEEGEEQLRDAADARDWQDSIKKALANEVQRRVREGQAAQQGSMETIHNSIELLRGNPDILPGAKQFDRELADAFIELVSPYAIKNEAGKTQGWSIDVKPMLAAARAQVAKSRVAAPAATGPSAAQQRAAGQPRNAQQQFTTPEPVDRPQAGIQSQAGQAGDDGETLDTLFGTLGFAPGTFKF